MKLSKLLIGSILLLGSCKSMDCGCPMAEESLQPIQKKIVHSNTMDYSSLDKSKLNSIESHHHSDQKTCID